MQKNLNVGCGRIHEKSTEEITWTNLDQFEEVKPDIVCDMTKGLPFADGEFDHVKALACLGQIEANKDFLLVMNEIWRVLKQDGTLWVYLPHKDYQICWHDPFNQRRTNEDHWLGFDETHPQYIHHNSYYGFNPWKNVKVTVEPPGFISAWLTKKQI